ncbi:hypothetical protein [uncultured Arthrobacter sp.]|uniref:hypothetical protein n=1 Tax=uncultured Arthrobacter sp. TaxID=114050 RepID=UPI00260F2102|nr:hypothetical protein [uncultured Arthrobacter sp.]
MTEEWYKQFDQRMFSSISNSWRKHNQAAGKRQRLVGSIAALIGVCLLIPGVSLYVEVAYKDGDGGLGTAILFIAAAVALLIAGMVLSCMGFLNGRKAGRRTRTYEDLVP